MTLKTISGHYGAIYHLAHNNRDFVPKNVDINRIPWNYNCVTAGQIAYLDIDIPWNINEFWERYRELNAMYWSDRAIANMLAYEKYQEHLEYMRRLSQSIYPIPHNPVEAFITLLFLPLLIPCGIYLSHRQRQIKEEWETFKQEQWIRDMAYKATRVSLRGALYEHDRRMGRRIEKIMDNKWSQRMCNRWLLYLLLEGFDSMKSCFMFGHHDVPDARTRELIIKNVGQSFCADGK